MDAVMEFLISKVARRVVENPTLIVGIKDGVLDLVRELRLFKAYLRCNAGNAVVRDDVVQKIEEVVYDAEDAIDKYLSERWKHRARPVLKRWAKKLSHYIMVNGAAKEIESIKKRAEKIRLDYAHCSPYSKPVRI